MPEQLTIQAYWNNTWHDTGQVVLRSPEQGLTGSFQFYYAAHYINTADTFRPGMGFIDERSVGINLPGNFVRHFNERHIAPVLRDMIPQGSGRRALLKLWGEKDTGPGLDVRLLKEGCVSPIGNLRIKEAAETFQDRISNQEPAAFTRDNVSERNDELIEHAHNLGIAIGGATGAGGDAPKLLMVEDDEGKLYLEGTIAESRIAQHWLIKFPRGRMLQDDEDILRAESVFYQTLEELGVNTIKGAHIQEGRVPALWMPRFDRAIVAGQVHRYGMESVYSLMRMVGDGARLQHMDVLRQLTQHLSANRDAILVDYLLRDIINSAIGNTDNHGRNTAIIKRDGILELAPAFDLAPMVLDREAIARTTVWPKQLQQRDGVNYTAVLRELAGNPEGATKALIHRLETLEDFRDRAIQNGLPDIARDNPRINLDKFGQVARAIQNQWRQAPDMDLDLDHYDGPTM